MADKCKECGCMCKQCTKDTQEHYDMHLHVEIENLRQRLMERDHHIVTMETQFLNEAEKFPNGELASLKEEVMVWQNKYTRLHEAHKRVQKVNQSLEDKLLRIVDKCETEKGAFTKDIATLSHRLADANYTIHRLTQDNEKYRNDVNLAIQLLQCKPSNFVGQKYELLPPEVQAKVRTYVAHKNRFCETPTLEVKSITVPISTFPPTAMVYNVAKPVIDKQDANSDDESKPSIDMVSAAVMAKVLEDREKDRIFARHCNTCVCHRSVLKVDTETQTIEDENKVPNLKDYFSTFDHNAQKNSRNSKDFHQLDVKEMSLNNIRNRSQLNDLNTKRATFHNVNEAVDSKHNLNGENSKLFNQYSSNSKNYMNLTNKSKNKSILNESNSMGNFKSVNGEERIECQSGLNRSNISVSDKKSTKDIQNFDDQAKIDMINERLWKSSWMNSTILHNAKESDIQLEVINERAWKKSSKSPVSDKPLRLTMIEVKSSDDSSKQSDKVQTVSATSPAFSGDSMLISSSDPSSLASLSSDMVTNPAATCKTTSAKQERVSGPRNCLMRMTPGSKNILLDNVGAYQTVLYTSGSNKANTALVHVGKSSRSGRSASISSEENSSSVPCTTAQDSAHLQRVAQWVDTLSNRSSDCDSHAAQPIDTSSEAPLLSPESKVSSTGDQALADLMTFGGSSDDEHKLTIDFDYQANITKEMEETYLKLAASFDSSSTRCTNTANIDMMTLEQYRKEQKRSHLSSQVKSKT